MILFGLYVAAGLLLVGAGAAKAVHPADTSRALGQSLSWWPEGRRGVNVLRALAVAEAVVGAAALALPRPALAAAVAGSYVTFAAFVALARRRGGSLSTCGCFGAPDTPPTASHLLLDLCLAGAAIAVGVAGGGSDLLSAAGRSGADGTVVVLLGVVLAGLSYLVLVPLARLEGLRGGVSVAAHGLGSRPEPTVAHTGPVGRGDVTAGISQGSEAAA